MIDMARGALGEWLDRQFIDWQRESGKSQTLERFAEWLEISRVTLSRYINGQRQTPDEETIELLASKLGPGIYDVLGIPRPDPDLQTLVKEWGTYSNEKRAAIMEFVHSDDTTLATQIKVGKPKRSKP